MGTAATIQYANQTSYEGRVKDEKPEGKGKILFKDKTSIQGQFQSGSLKNGKLLTKGWGYEGQFQEGKINGKGRLIDSTNTTYEGNFKGGKLIDGKITEKREKENILKGFTGKIEDDKIKEGVLTVTTKSNSSTPQAQATIQLQGTFEDYNLAGTGIYTFSNGDTYSGIFSKGKRNGKGVYKTSSFTLQCQFTNDHMEGQCSVAFENGDKYEGNTKSGELNGWGKYTYSDGTVYEGDFYCGSMWGQCKVHYTPGNEIESYQGEISEGQFTGIGTLFYANGVIFKGYFQNGMKNGHGAYIYGSSKYKCLYIMNRLIGQLKSIQ